MNAVIEAIMGRRSIRSYKPDGIPAGDLELIGKAGLYAPSSRNSQPWHVTAVRSAGLINRINAELKDAIRRCRVERYLKYVDSPSYHVSFSAPVFVIVSADPNRTYNPEADCALVLGSMFLAAHSLGIGSCWVNQLGPVGDDPQFRALLAQLGVPEPNKIYGSAAFGRNAGPHPAAAARKDGTFNFAD